jgi:outer membrane protein insertion porin family
VEDLPRAAAAAARRWYLNRGHAGVEAKAAFGTDEEGQEVVQVDLNPGPLVRVTKVILDGGEVLNQELLRRHLLSASRVVLRHSLVTPSILAHDREALVRLFAGSGYLDVKVSEPALEWRGRDEVVLTFRIEPGTRRLVSEVVFLGVDAALAPEIRERFAPEIGQPPEPDKLEDSVVDLQHFYDENGYADAIVYWRLERSDDGGARVRFDVQEGPMLTVRQVIIDGLVVTREYVVRREIEVAPGDVYRRSQLLATQRRVRDLGMFRSVVVRGEDVPGVDGLRDLVIEVKERDNLDLAVGLGFDNDEGVRASFSLGNRNYLGRGGTLSFQGRISGELISGELRNGWRRLGGSHNDLLGALSIRQQIRQGFSEERQAAVLQMSRPINRRTTLQARYRLENFSLYDVETFLPNETNLNETFVQEGRLGSIGGSLVRKTFDDPLLPGKGALRTIDLSLYSRDLGSQFEFGRFFFQQGRVWTFHEGRWGYLLNGRFGFMWPYGDTGAVPLAERFFAGGISSVRGYRQDRLGPANTSTGEPIGGESVFVLNNEVRLRLSGNLSARIFVDAGNAFLRARDIDLGDLKYTAGPGLSYATPVGPLRMYYGFKLNPETDEEESGRFHVTFGAVF